MNSVRAAKKHFAITKKNWPTPFKEVIPVYSESHANHINRK
jgi:hypothetical protein